MHTHIHTHTHTHTDISISANNWMLDRVLDTTLRN